MKWEATALDGSEFSSLTTSTYERVNDRGGARSLRVWFGDNDKPVHVSCIPGESIHLFTRRAIIDALSANARQLDMPVIELRRQDKTYTRLYVHPDHGFIFSTMDLNL